LSLRPYCLPSSHSQWRRGRFVGSFGYQLPDRANGPRLAFTWAGQAFGTHGPWRIQHADRHPCSRRGAEGHQFQQRGAGQELLGLRDDAHPEE
ncbi:ENTPD7, partial [Symbiodinium pilosum]